jgi:hypothetical protein
MIGEHAFWWLLTMACMVWYSTITVYVAVKGAIDIRVMLKRLAEGADEDALEAAKQTAGEGH